MTLEQIIDKILQMHAIGIEIDDEIPTCGMGQGYQPQWHIFNHSDFKRVANELNGGKFNTIYQEDSTYRCLLEFEYRGVKISTLTDSKMEEESNERN